MIPRDCGIRTYKTEPPPPSGPNRPKRRGGGSDEGFFQIWDPFLSVFPLRNRILGVPKTPKFSACGGLSPLTEPSWLIFWGYLSVSPLETAVWGSGSDLPNPTPTRATPLQDLRSRKQGGGRSGRGGSLGFICPDVPAIELVAKIN